MPLVDARNLLEHAGSRGYAVCSFDLAGLDFLAAAVTAAENCRAPAILGVAEPHLDHLAAEHFLPAVEAAARRTSVPVAIQFTRVASVAAAVRAIGLGCNGVALNGAGRTPEEHIARIRTVVEMAHGCGVPVEGGLNAIAHLPGESPASLDVVRRYVEHTGIDVLAVADASPVPLARLDFARLEDIRGATALPLAVDAVRDFTDAEYQRLIERGVAKIHHYAGLSRAAGGCLRRNVRATPRNGYLRLMKGVQQALGAEVERCLRLSGSAGRAPEAQAHCRPWRPVEHCIVYNVAPGGDEGERAARAMMADGRRILGAIPGVRAVFTGRALCPDAGYRYCWLVRFAHPAVIESYRDHTGHVAFADGRFRLLAPDGLSLDFEEVP
ncbi:MAG: class II fructose-bisphosphate aldolase [Gammaproteobacteria bacterium]|nr:class II fructose-bisphosphate aldolase [Rhodospirillales bacterium]MDA8364505.1 class II fructose-bisphosphate aldolase [Gammaproteobacteria bacterium]